MGSYDLTPPDDEDYDVERELHKYEDGIRAFKGHVKREDFRGEYLETVENTLTQMNTY